MKGWTEEEIRNKDLMAPCGLYCGVCAVYIATRDKNDKFKKIIGNLYGTKPEETECLGCMQPEPPKNIYVACNLCKIRGKRFVNYTGGEEAASSFLSTNCGSSFR